MPTRSRVRRTRTRARMLPVALSLLMLLATAAGASAQRAPKPQKPRYGDWPSTPIGIPVELRQGAARVVINESEPNNTAATADTVNIGDEVIARMDTAQDLDVYIITVPANTTLALEVFAQREGSTLDSYLEIYSATTTTLLAENDDADPPGRDSRLRYTTTQAGSYLIVVSDYFGRGGTNYTYRLVIGTTAPAPGDPTTIFADSIDGAWSTAAGLNELFVVQQNGGVARVTANGTVSELYYDDDFIPYDVAIDGFGRLLVAGFSLQSPERGYVRAINLTNNQVTTLIGPIESAVSITVGPDGDIYVANTIQCEAAGCSLLSTSRIQRFDPRGVPKESIPIAGTHGQLVDLAFSPAGVLHYSNVNNGIFRIVNNQPQRVVTASAVGGLAFDRDGNIYLGTSNRGITLYGPNYQVIADPFASSGLAVTGNVVFGRDEQGGMTNRLYGINLGDGTVREVNRAAVRAPGFRIGVDLLVFATDSVRPGIMGGEYADTLRIEGMATGVSWSVVAGSLPPGVSLSAATGVLSGIPQTSGNFTFTARAVGQGRTGLNDFTLSVIRPIVDRGAATDFLLGVTTRMSPALQRFMDLQGNKNGRYDIGDLRAYLRAQSNPGGGE